MTGASLRYIRPKLEPGAVDGQLYFFHGPDRPECQIFRQAADALRDTQKPGAVLWMTGCRVGRGTSMACINLASALAEQSRVTLMDLSFGRPALGPRMGLLDVKGVGSAVRQRRRDPGASFDVYMLGRRLNLVPLEQNTPNDLIYEEAIISIVEDLRTNSDLVLIDGPPISAYADRDALLSLVDGVVIVAGPDDLASGAFEATVALSQSVGVAGTFINEGSTDP